MSELAMPRADCDDCSSTSQTEDLVVHAFIEIPAGSRNKYEYDHKKGVFRLDRTLYSPVHYPTEYGFVPGTLGEDGDPIDIMVMVSGPTFPGCHIETRVVGALEMTDDMGVDVKLLGVAVVDPRFCQVRGLCDVPSHIRMEIEYFFSIYKDLEGKKTQVDGWKDLEYARQKLSDAVARYRSGEAGTTR